MSGVFLSDKDVEQLTGRKIADKQIEWLRRHGIRHFVNARGKPVVPKDALGGQNDEFRLGQVT